LRSCGLAVLRSCGLAFLLFLPLLRPFVLSFISSFRSFVRSFLSSFPPFLSSYPSVQVVKRKYFGSWLMEVHALKASRYDVCVYLYRCPSNHCCLSTLWRLFYFPSGYLCPSILDVLPYFVFTFLRDIYVLRPLMSFHP
jgi:hypothetical protein